MKTFIGPSGYSYKEWKGTFYAKDQKPDGMLRHFLRVASELEKKQGPLLFQLPPNFKKDLPRLVEFLALIPASVRAAFEFRHASWCKGPQLAAELGRILALA